MYGVGLGACVLLHKGVFWSIPGYKYVEILCFWRGAEHLTHSAAVVLRRLRCMNHLSPDLALKHH